ncbi:MAG: SanA/YdcF family protein [Candidatus Heteroscillospira sp.]|jgi:SanA protein
MTNRKIKSFFLRALALLLVLGILGGAAVLGLNLYICSSAGNYLLTPEEAAELDGADCILILGCAVWANNTPSPMLADRLERGVELYKAGAAPKIIVSGDHGREYYDEVNVMRSWCLDAGVPAEDLFMDHAGFSTYESVYRARDVFACKKLIIVTQEYHLYRAVYSARALGLDAYGVASDLRPYGGQFYRDVREVLARVKDFFYVRFDVQPTYLGDVIPVSGNGNATLG